MNLNSLVEAAANGQQDLDRLPTGDLLPPNIENLKKVYYLPVGLSPVQRDLIEILIKLHKNSILKQFRDEEEGITESYIQNNSNETDLSSPLLSESDLQNLLYRNLTLIANHPYLLVEHYMPTKLLLMESHERLFLSSDKFEKFDKLLNGIQGLSLNVVIVGHNIKELDLIEAFILGRSLNYKRYSGAQIVESQKSSSQSSAGSDQKNSNGSTSGSDKKSGKEDDYIPRSQKHPKVKASEFPLTLHLITYQQLKSTFFENTSLDFIISFDPFIDENDSHVEYLRTYKGKLSSSDQPIPLIKIIVAQSHQHGFLTLKDSNEDELKITQKTLYSAIANRSQDNSKLFDESYGVLFDHAKKFFQDPINNHWPIKGLPNFKLHTDEEIVQSLDQDFSVAFNTEGPTHKKIKSDVIVVPQQLTVKEYHQILAKLTIARISGIEKAINLNKEKIKPFKLKSTIKHNQSDNIKLKIADLFKESKKLQEEASSAEKRYERLELEYEKYETNEKSLTEKKDYLEKVESGEIVLKDEELDSELKELESFLSNLKTENEELSIKSDELRSEYQQITSDAAEKSGTAKLFETKDKELADKIQGQGKKLRLLINEDVKISNQEQAKVLQRNLKFLKIYNTKLSETVKEKVSTLTVGRNGRVYRSTTPYI
ncbi:HDA1 complex subunit 2 [Wickerhamomyces ciferrii]|uniref:HDA1 complex subunit 2 n=1 Tax=Wickerhamomyces ciferrii (strain ATCC 14091 / BCRC 22168 / CBS 111 / JCM 3599 / NBRC 0793 / NRRL Y-1031 F-60-10) TaxID=1206466 RepID=K0KXX1_WICCF|nr:HDA1 complex subunit 2 [Wickerhamomyces ciferrii]CCH46284.1 HDA1 complex subunit 2 [Wickerhamomyces ciferrii]